MTKTELASLIISLIGLCYTAGIIKPLEHPITLEPAPIVVCLPLPPGQPCTSRI
ncbi:TPA: hypothetical protein ACLEYZ_005807 [Pseudomonas aeruginosa]